MSQTFRVYRWFVVALFCGNLLASRPTFAETFWQRVRHKNAQSMEELIVSTEKVLWGLGDELDMFRVRTALVALSRGEIIDPRVVVLLHRLRRELRLSPGRNSTELLHQALTGRLAATYRAWAWIELSYVSISQSAPRRALLELDNALKSAWRVEDRAAIDVLAGWLLLGERRTSEAQERLSRLENRGAPRRLITQARVGQALTAVMNGDRELARSFAIRASSLQARRASVSGVDLFWELQLDESTQAAADLILIWGRAGRAEQRGDQDVAEREKRVVCEQLFGESEWTQLLAQMWRLECDQTLPAIPPE